MLGEIKSIFHIPLGWFEKVDRWLSSVHPGRMISFGSDPENPEIEVDMDTFRAEVQKIAHGGDLTHSDITDWDSATAGFANRPTINSSNGARFPVVFDFDSLTMHYMDLYHWVPTLDTYEHGNAVTDKALDVVTGVEWDGTKFVVHHKTLKFASGYFVGKAEAPDTYIETIPYNP